MIGFFGDDLNFVYKASSKWDILIASSSPVTCPITCPSANKIKHNRTGVVKDINQLLICCDIIFTDHYYELLCAKSRFIGISSKIIKLKDTPIRVTHSL